MHNATIRVGDRDLFKGLDWNVGPGDRIGIAGVNGAGKTTLLKVLTGQLELAAGKLVTGTTVNQLSCPSILRNLILSGEYLKQLNTSLRTWKLVKESH